MAALVGHFVAAALSAAAVQVGAVGPQERTPLYQGLDIRPGVAPSPVRIGDELRLAYELQLSNFASSPVEVVRIEVVDPETRASLLDLQGPALSNALGAAPEVGPNAFVMAHLDIASERAPRALTHRLTYGVTARSGERRLATVEAGTIQIDATDLPVLGPPLKGGPWVAVYQPEMPRGHRRVVYAVDGKARVPGRFAIDFIRVDENGGQLSADDKRLTSNLSFGAEVLAVADGVVVAVRDDVPDPADLDGVDSVTLRDATGNYVVLDIGNRRYAFYEHLSPDVRVRVGDRVTRGQVIAALGFTGQASGPHLHFHVSDGIEPLPSEGRPYLMEGYRRVGQYPSIEAFGRGDDWPQAPALAEGPAFPPPNAVVMFD